jgi:hypothetical protein
MMQTSLQQLNLGAIEPWAFGRETPAVRKTLTVATGSGRNSPI